MATSRTGTTKWKALQLRSIREAQRDGLEHCRYCGVTLDYLASKRPSSAEADHIIPHARGGIDAKENVQVICRRCNQSKGDKVAPKPHKATPVSPKPLKTSRQW